MNIDRRPEANVRGTVRYSTVPRRMMGQARFAGRTAQGRSGRSGGCSFWSCSADLPSFTFASTRPIDVVTLAPDQNAGSRCRRLVQQEQRRGAAREEEEKAERREGRGEEMFGQRGEKGHRPEEFSTVKLVGEERGGTGEGRQGRSFSSQL